MQWYSGRLTFGAEPARTGLANGQFPPIAPFCQLIDQWIASCVVDLAASPTITFKLRK